MNRILSSRALTSTNWRVKDPVNLDHARSQPHPSQQLGDSLTFQKPVKLSRKDSERQARPRASPARVHVGNLLYIAQRKDVELLFAGAGLKMYEFLK